MAQPFAERWVPCQALEAVGEVVGRTRLDKESVLAGLLLFRLLYYIAPFTLALIILGTRELWLNVKGARRPRKPELITSVTAPIRSEIEGRKTDAD